MQKNRKLQKIKRISLNLILVILALILFVITMNGIYSFYESKKYVPPGEMIETSNGNMHVYHDLKDNDEPTYVFLAALGGESAYYGFKMLWEPLSENASVVAIDYLGYGMSETTKKERTLDHITDEIDEALTAIGAEGPYTFVAHSLGGFYSTAYSLKHPDKVEKIVFIDNTPPQYAANTTEVEAMKAMKGKVDLMKITGLNRLSGTLEIPGLTKEEQKAATYVTNRMAFNKTIMNEIDHIPSNASYLLDKIVPDSIPTLMLLSNENEAQGLEWGIGSWVEFHEDMMNQNESSKILRFDAGHYIHYDNPGGVLSAIREFVQK